MALVSALAGSLLLGACTGGGDDPAPTGSSSASPSTTSSTAPTTTTAPPTTTAKPTKTTPAVDPVVAKIPKAARPKTLDGAEKFARFYIDQVNEAWGIPDPLQIDGLATSACKTCTAFSQTANDLKTNGEKHKSETLVVKSSSALTYQPSDIRIAVEVSQRAVDVITNGGKVIRTTEAGKGTFILALIYKKRWLVADLGVAK